MIRAQVPPSVTAAPNRTGSASATMVTGPPSSSGSRPGSTPNDSTGRVSMIV